MSGALADFKGDVQIDPKDWGLTVECKHYKNISNYDRLEKHLDEGDVVLVDTPTGVYRWVEHAFFILLLKKAFGEFTPGIPANMRERQLKTGSALKRFEGWIKGCDLLAVKQDYAPWRWWVSNDLWWEILQRAATGPDDL